MDLGSRLEFNSTDPDLGNAGRRRTHELSWLTSRGFHLDRRRGQFLALRRIRRLRDNRLQQLRGAIQRSVEILERTVDLGRWSEYTLRDGDLWNDRNACSRQRSASA